MVTLPHASTPHAMSICRIHISNRLSNKFTVKSKSRPAYADSQASIFHPIIGRISIVVIRLDAHRAFIV